MARIDTLQNFLADISDKFRAKLGTTGKIIHAEYDTKIDDVYEAGKTAEYDRFWDNLQNYGKRTNYEYAFCGAEWTDDIFKPKYPIIASTVQYMFRGSGVTYVPTVDFRNRVSLSYAFAYGNNIVTIEKIILKDDGSNTFTTSTFGNCGSLENVRFEGVIGSNISFAPCNKLTSDSIDDIINHLKDLTGSTAQTITFHSTVGNKLTDTQKSNIQSKNWSAVY